MSFKGIEKLEQLVKQKKMARRNNEPKSVLDKIQKEISIETLLYLSKARKQRVPRLRLIK